MASRDGFQVALRLDASQFKTEMKRATDEATRARKDFNALDKVLSNMDNSYLKNAKKIDGVNKAIVENNKVLNIAEKRYKELKKEIELSGEATKKQQKELIRLDNAVNNHQRHIASLSGKKEKLVADQRKVTKGFIANNKTTQAFNQTLSETGRLVGETGKAMTAFISLPIAGAFIKGTQNALDFQDTMNKYRVVTQDSEEATKKMGNVILGLSSEYGIANEKITESTVKLAKTGYTSSEIQKLMTSGLQGSIVAGEDYDGVITALKGTMRSFNIDTNDASITMDKLVAVANASSTGVTELGQGMSIVGSLASTMNIPLEDVASAIGVLSDRNITANVAANGLKTGLSRVVQAAGDFTNGGKMSAATKAMKDMGVDLADIQKNGVNLPKLLKEIDEGTKGMTSSQIANNLQLAFGKDHLKTWATLAGGEAQESLAKYTKEAKEAEGSTARLAEEMKKSPRQAINIMKESMKNASITFGQGFLDVAAEPLAELSQKVQEVATDFTNMDKESKKAVVGISGIAAGIGPALFIFGKLIESTASIKENLFTLGKMSLPMTAVVVGISSVSSVLLDGVKNSDDLKDRLSSMWDTVVNAYNQSGVKEAFAGFKKALSDLLTGNDKNNGGDKKANAMLTVQKIADTILPILENVLEVATKVIEVIDQVPTSVLKWGFYFAIAGKSILGISNFVLGLKDGFDKVKNSVEVIGRITGLSKLKEKVKNVKKETDKTKKSSDKVKGSFTTWASEKVSGPIKSVKKWTAQLKDDMVDLGGKIKKIPNNITTWTSEKVSGAKSFLSNTLNTVKTKANEAKTKIGQVTSPIFSWGSDKVKGATSGLNNALNTVKSKANEAKDKIGGISSKIISWSSDKVKSGFNSLKGALGSVTNKADEAKKSVGGITSAVSKTGGKGGKNGKGGFFTGLLGSLSNLLSKSKLVNGAIKGISTAFALMTGPVGIAVGAIALIGGTFVTAYKNCKPFRDFVDKIAGKMKKAFKKALDWAIDFGKGLTDTIVNKTINPISVSVGAWKIAKKFKKHFDKARDDGQSFGESMKTALGKTCDDIVTGIKKMPFVTKFMEKFNTAKSKMETFKKDMKTKLSNLLGDMKTSIENSKIGKAFGTAFEAVMGFIKDPLNSIIDGANWVIHKLGGPERTIPAFPPKKYANGTKNGGHPGGLAIVNDGHGPHYQEAITLPNGNTFIPKGKNILMDLPKGTQVADGRTTSKAMKAGLLRYKDGTDESWIGKVIKFGKKAVSKLGSIIGDVIDYMDNPGKLAKKVLENVVNFGNLINFPLDIGKGVLRKGVEALTNKIKEMFESMSFDDGSGLDNTVAANGVYQYLVNMAKDIIKRYGGTMTSGYRPGSKNELGQPDDHSKRQAIDVSGVSYSTYNKMKHYLVNKYRNKGLKYVIANNTWATKSGGWRFTHYPYGGHMDHIHISGEKPGGKIFKAASDAGSYNYKGGGGVMPRSEISKLVKRALKANGLPSSGAWYDMVMKRVYQESGGNPRAINLWDSNAKAGHPSKGLVQMIDSTFNAYKFPGHDNIYNPYDNLLSAINYMKKKYGLQGMIARAGIGYEKGGLVTTHQMAEIAEGNKPEMIIPLTNKSRSVQLINKARKLIGEDELENDTSDLKRQNEELKEMNGKLNTMIDLLASLLQKDTNIYMDSTQVAKATANPMQNEISRINQNANRLRGFV